MAKRERRNDKLRIDLSALETHSVLLEDLRYYVGSPKAYVPKIWDVCMDVLRDVNRIILNDRDNADTLDGVWNQFFDDFSEKEFRRIVREKHLSVRMDGYRENVAHFLYEVFEIMYPQVAGYADRRTRGKENATNLNFKVHVIEVVYDDIYDGFDTINKEIAAIVEVETENLLTKRLLSEKGYGF